MAGRIKNVKRNMIWGGVNSIVTILLPFLSRTAVIYTIGIEYTGLNTLFQSVLQALSFAELGIGSAMVFSMYKPMAENNTDAVCALLNFYRLCYRIIGVVVLVLGLFLLPFMNDLIAGDAPSDINLNFLYIIYLLNNVTGYLCYAYKSSLLSASQRVDWIARVNIIIQIIKTIIQMVAVIAIRNYYFFAIALPVTTFLNNIIVDKLTKKIFPQYECRGKIEKYEVKIIGEKVGGMVFQKVGSIILSSADAIVISAFLGLKILGIYNGYFYIITALTSVLAIIHRSLIPSIGNSIVKESVDKNIKDFEKFHFLYVWIISWCCTCLVCLFQPFIRIWQGSNNMLSDQMVFLFAIYFFLYHVGDMSHIYKEALGLWWEGKFIPMVSSLINLGLNIMLVKVIGLAGVLLSTIVSVLFINMPFVAYIIFKYYFKKRGMWKQYLMKNIFYFIIACAISSLTYVATKMIPLQGIPQILGILACCVFMPNVFYFLIYKHMKVYKEAKTFVVKLIPQRRP